MNGTVESTVESTVGLITDTISHTTALSTVAEGDDQRTVENMEQLSDAALGAIIGGAVVGLILLLTLSVTTAFCYYRQRRLKLFSQNGSLNAFTYSRQINDGSRMNTLGPRSPADSLPRNPFPEESHDPAPVPAPGDSLRSGLIVDTGSSVFPVQEEPLRRSRQETSDAFPAEVDSVDRRKIRSRNPPEVPDKEPEIAVAVVMDTQSINSLDEDEYNRVIDEAFGEIDNFAFNNEL